MKPRSLEHKHTVDDDLYFVLWIVFIPLMLLMVAVGQGDVSLAGVVLFIVMLAIMAVAYIIARALAFKDHLQAHQTALIELANANDWELQSDMLDYLLPPELSGSSLLLVADRDRRILNYMKTPSWNYIDLAYDIYTQTKNGEYKAKTVYYSILVTQLPRVLPNVFFDSKTEDGRKYKAKFTADQRRQLEGDFDQYFDTYFAEGYTIDSMSFITPDVMQAMEAASSYDIEIIGDRLLLYGPVYLEATNIQNGAAKLLAILKTLQITAQAYRDERLSGAAAAQTVTPAGMQLRRKGVSKWTYVAAGLIYLIFLILKLRMAGH